jgi:serine/threonine protein kinase
MTNANAETLLQPASRRGSLAPGTVLQGTYRIVGPLARGGCGEVYVAEHTRLPQRFAVKVLQSNLAHNPEALSRFRGEAEITSTLRHPHIVTVLDFNVTETGMPYLVMELLDGRMLADRLADGPVDGDTTIKIIDQIAHALHAAHERGIIHRDLKPENVMLLAADGVEDFVKVLDFGISRASWRPRVTGVQKVAGTPEFMSPEQASARPDIDHRSDQFSLAGIAYMLLTGREPFCGDDPLGILQQVVYVDPPPPSRIAPRISPEIDAVVMRGLSKRPEDRYPDVIAFSVALKNAIQGCPATSGPERASFSPAAFIDVSDAPPPVRASAQELPPVALAPAPARRGVGPAPWDGGEAGPETRALIRRVTRSPVRRLGWAVLAAAGIVAAGWFAPPTRAMTRQTVSYAEDNARAAYHHAVEAAGFTHR